MYDDPSAQVLRRHLATSGGALNEKLAALSPQEANVLAEIPDHLFALVGTFGGAPLRKYAMHDPEHLATSILYFLECGGQLPETTRAKVAMRLIEGCGWYDTPPPLALTKVAVLGAVLNSGAVLAGAPNRIRRIHAEQAAGDLALRQAQMGKHAARARSTNNETEAQKALDAFIRGETQSPEEQYAAFGDHYPSPFEDKQHLVKDAAPMSTALQPFKSVTNHITRQGRLADSIARKQDLADALSSSALRKTDPARVRSLQGRLDDRVQKLRRVHQAEGRAGFDRSWEAEAPLREEYVKTRKFAAEMADAVKEANTAGTEVHSFGGLSDDPRPKTPAKRFAMAPKVSSDMNLGEIDFVMPEEEVAGSRHYALPHRALYPIDTEGQVKRASEYFDEYYRDFTIDDRRMFAQSVAARAEELDVSVGSTIAKFAGNEYGPHIRAELQGRILALEGTGKEASYQVLLESLNETPPIVMYDMLKMADEDSGMDAGYGRPVTGFKDPLSAVFGAPEKPIYTWCAKGAYVTEEQLRSFSKLVPDLDKVIEKDFSVKFVDDPVGTFDKLPEPKKIVIARLANGEAFRWM